MDRKAKYIEFCEKHYVPLMFRPWWLDAVCPNEWDVCVSFDKGGAVTGVLVYYLTRYKGFPIIKMPPLTDYSGLWLNYPHNLQKPAARYGFAKKVITSLIKQLPDVYFFYQQWHPTIDNWLPFSWHGFRQATLYTYRFDLIDENTLYNNLQKSARKNIAKARQKLTVEKGGQIEDIYRLVNLSFARQKLSPAYTFYDIQRLDDILNAKSRRNIYLAYDEEKNLHAGVYLIWDEHCAYSILSGSDPEFRHMGGQYLLQWQSMIDCLGRTNQYDLCGSVLEPVEESLRSFGGTLIPHYKIFKAKNKVFKILSILLNKNFY